MLPRNVLRYGRETPLPEQVALRAGPLTLVYEIDRTLGGDLRYVKLGGREVLRRVYVAVRDRNWGTVPTQVSNVQLTVEPDSFHMTYDAQNQARDAEGEIDFFWTGTIVGAADGTITFTMDGVARSTFLRNRIGFCVLHPMDECAGQPCTVEHTNGAIERGEFPQYISPHQPFKHMRAISHHVFPGVQAEVRFAGDVFEMEDQRNWSDASFKTYSTPLALPIPVTVEAGTRIQQSITLTLKGQVPQLRADSPAEELTVTVDREPRCPLPRIGLGSASDGQSLSARELARLAGLNLAHLRVDLHLSQPGYEAALRRAASQGQKLDVPLAVALFLSDRAEDELQALLRLVEEIEPSVCTWLVFHRTEPSTHEPGVRLVRRILAPYDPQARIGGGSNGYFTALNRTRPPHEALDVVCYSLTPQVHTFDNASLVEALATQAVMLESARQFVGDRPIAISPITLKPRFVPGGSGPAPEFTPGELPPQVDPRQMSLFGAGWTATSLKYVAQGGAHSVTYYETAGWRGVMERASGSPLPNQFHSLPGAVFPLYHVLADVGEFADGEVVDTLSSHPLRVDGLAVRDGDRRRAILANLSPTPQQVTVKGLGGQVALHRLDETNAEQAMRQPKRFRAQPGERRQTCAGKLMLDLLPYGLVRIDEE